MNNFPKVFIIILNYNGKDTIKQCLGSAFQLDYPNLEVVMVDNDSSDGSLELAKEFFPRAHFIKNEKNIGFAAGNNIGIRFALEKMADYIFLLNNDAVIKEDTVSKLVNVAEREGSIGIVGPIVYKDNSDTIWFAGGKLNWITMRASHVYEIFSDSPYKTQYVSGCAILIKKEVFKKIGLLDERFFLYYEDADFCIRASRSGLYSLVVPNASAFHFEKSEGDKKAKTYWLVLSGLSFFKKNTSLFLKPWINLYIFLRKIKNKRDVFLGNNDLSSVVQKAYYDHKHSK